MGIPLRHKWRVLFQKNESPKPKLLDIEPKQIGMFSLNSIDLLFKMGQLDLREPPKLN